MLALTLLLSLQQPAPMTWHTQLPDDRRATDEGILMPGKALIRRGASIVVKGSLRDPNNPAVPLEGKVFLRSGTDTRATVNAKGDFALTWNTGSESRPDTKIQIRYVLNSQSQETLLRSCDVSFASSEPITLALQEDANGVTVTSTLLSGVTLEEPKLYVDGNEVNAKPAGDGKYLVEKRLLASPNEKASIQLVAQSSMSGRKTGVVAAPAALVAASQGLKITSTKAGLTLPDNPFETMLTLDVEGNPKADSVRVFLDGRPTACKQAGSQVHIDPRMFDPDIDKEIWLQGQDQAGGVVYSRKTKIADLGIPVTWNALAAKIDDERARLARVFALDLGKWRDIKTEDALINHRVVLGFEYKLAMDKSFKEASAGSSSAAGRRGASPSRQTYPNAFGVSFRTARVVPAYGSLDQVAASVEGYWKDTDWFDPPRPPKKPVKNEKSLIETMRETLASPENTRPVGFLGPYHKRIHDYLVESLGDWMAELALTKTAREVVIKNPSQVTLQEFTKQLNNLEAARLRCNIARGMLLFESGQAPPPIVVYNWIPAARSQNDTDVVTGKKIEGFNYLAKPIDPRLFP